MMLTLSSLFGDFAVFQSGIAVPVWGWTEPDCIVECNFNGQTLKVKSTPEGKFMLRLSPMQYGGPYELNVRNIKSGESVCVRDIMIGEVWLASGQSNMAMMMAATNDDVSLSNADCAMLRMITVPRTARVGGSENFNAKWSVSTPENAAAFSAVAYHFAHRIISEQGVAVGIINSSWGGTVAEAWTSREALIRNPDFQHTVQSYESKLYSPKVWEFDACDDVCDIEAIVAAKIKGKFGFDVPPNNGFAAGWAKPDFPDDKWRSMTLPGGWVAAGEKYNGVIWFRLTVDIPAKLAGRDWQLDLGAIDKQDITYFNGEQVGATGTGYETVYWNAQRQYTVPARLVKPGRNVIAVRAFSFMYEGGLIGPKAVMTFFPKDNPAAAIPLAGEWKFETEWDLGTQMVSSDESSFGPGVRNSPYMLYDNMIKPVLPYAIRGAIWYQGESNEKNLKFYRNLMIGLINDWRRAWGQGDFPFYQVQLANYRQPQNYQENSGWAQIREAQLLAGRSAGCGVAVIIDAGEEEDIHPHDKKTVGERLAALALRQTYQKLNIVPCGPVYKSMTIEGKKIRLTFEHCEDGLKCEGGGFFIADHSKEFKEATVTIDGDTILVGRDDIENPVAVRYAWADNPAAANLQNGADLPATPFRTDTW